MLLISNTLWKTTLISLAIFCTALAASFIDMQCSYGARGSLTSTCVNATPGYFKYTPYKFDNLDETVRCINCNLSTLESATFDLSGNRIKTLDLTASNISIIKVRAFIGLMFLKNLLMPHNFIRSIYPSTFEGIKNIEYLDLQNNSISLLANDAFKELVNLKVLNLKDNYIKTVQESAFNGLVSLRELYMERNQIVNITGIFRTNLSSLETINLESNRIAQIDENDFIGLKTLESLDLSNNVIQAIPQNVFRYLELLEILSLSWNPINSVLPGSFEGLNSLEILNLDNCNLRELVPKTWQGLLRLRELRLSYNRIFEFQTKMYASLPQLSILNISHNEIEKVEKSGMFSLSLHVLDLSYNNITAFDYRSLLQHLPKLSFLALHHNPVICPVMHGMEEMFKEENMVFVGHFDSKCSYHYNPEDYAAEAEAIEAREAPSESSHANFVLVYSFMVLILVLVVVLFYAQYRTYQMLKMQNIRGYASNVNLVSSSDLQARDNDYLGD